MFVIVRVLVLLLGLTGFVRILLLVLISGFGLSLFLLLLIWSVGPQDSPNGSGILVQPALIDAHFRKAWMPYFRREGHPVVTTQALLDFVGGYLSQEPFLDLPILTGEDLYEAAMAKKSTAGGLGWLGLE